MICFLTFAVRVYDIVPMYLVRYVQSRHGSCKRSCDPSSYLLSWSLHPPCSTLEISIRAGLSGYYYCTGRWSQRQKSHLPRYISLIAFPEISQLQFALEHRSYINFDVLRRVLTRLEFKMSADVVDRVLSRGPERTTQLMTSIFLSMKAFALHSHRSLLHICFSFAVLECSSR